tara:strand:- start:1109 stop:3076 length:1968 start_codon:yes stop_codon:yes gene_type:complete
MGFNLGAFGAGFVGGLAETAEEQRKDMDGRIDKYLDFGVQRGAKVMDERKLQRAELTRLGNQLQQRMLSDEQISVLLEGGADNARSFLDAIKVSEQSMPDGKVYDASGLVTMENEKPSTMTWQDYVDKRIMGTANTSDVFSNSGVRPSSNGSILGKLFGAADTNTVSGDAVRDRAGVVGNTMGTTVEESLAASQDKFDRIADNKAAKGYIRLASNPLAQQQLLTAQRNHEVLGQQFKLNTLAIFKANVDRPNEALERQLKQLTIKNDILIAEFKIDSGTSVKELQLSIDILEKQAQQAGVPSSYEKASLFVAVQIGKMLEVPSEERDLDWKDKFAMLKKKQVRTGVDAIAFYSLKAGTEGSEIWTRGLLKDLFKTSQEISFAEEFVDGIDGIIQRDRNGEAMLGEGMGAQYGEAFARANANAYELWLEASQGRSASGKVFQVMSDMYKSYKLNFEKQYGPIKTETGESGGDDVGSPSNAILLSTLQSPDDVVEGKFYIVPTTGGKTKVVTASEVLNHRGLETWFALNSSGSNPSGSDDAYGGTQFSQGKNVRVWGSNSNDANDVTESTVLDGRFTKDNFPTAFSDEAITERDGRSMIRSISRDLGSASDAQKAALLVSAESILPRLTDSKDIQRLQIIISQLSSYAEADISDRNI